jgi:hypothetical protein
LLPGTRFHASMPTTPCEPAYYQRRVQCEAYVVRRGFDGTATVELRWDTDLQAPHPVRQGRTQGGGRASQTMTFTRNERGWTVRFGDDERFEIPEPLVFGG